MINVLNITNYYILKRPKKVFKQILKVFVCG